MGKKTFATLCKTDTTFDPKYHKLWRQIEIEEFHDQLSVLRSRFHITYCRLKIRITILLCNGPWYTKCFKNVFWSIKWNFHILFIFWSSLTGRLIILVPESINFIFLFHVLRHQFLRDNIDDNHSFSLVVDIWYLSVFNASFYASTNSAKILISFTTYHLSSNLCY